MQFTLNPFHVMSRHFFIKQNINIPYSEKIWRGFNLAQGKNEIFGEDLIWRSQTFLNLAQQKKY